MTLKKIYDNKTKVAIGNDAIMELRNGNWQFRMWIPKENKMYRKTLGTKNREIAEVNAINLVMDAKHRINNGKTFYSLTVKEAVASYVEERRGEVETGGIVIGRLGTIETHLKHFTDYIGEKTRLKDLNIDSCKGYFNFRMKKTVSITTLKNEQSTINSLIKYLNEKNETTIHYFKFKTTKELENADVKKIQRQTFTYEEWKKIYTAMRKYVEKTNHISHKDLLERQIARHWILIAANCGFRTGEQRQLRWSDVGTVKHNDKTLANVIVRAETSKVRKGRTVIGRQGQYFDRLKQLKQPKQKDEFVFFENGHKQTTNKIIYKHFKKIMELAKIKDWQEREIVPYSLRHFYITQRVKAGCSLREVADMCGTSVHQIEKTYWHTDFQTKLTTAIKTYEVSDDVIALENA